jgi:hypothetical protein
VASLDNISQKCLLDCGLALYDTVSPTCKVKVMNASIKLHTTVGTSYDVDRCCPIFGKVINIVVLLDEQIFICQLYIGRRF